LKPSNILVNENCDLKICDFGLARIQDPQMTGYVSTRYYRAPEIMLTWQKYDVEVDIWSAGCIFAEMLEGKPLFPGKDHVNQFSIITELLGTPPDDVIQTICSENVSCIVQLKTWTLLIFHRRFVSFSHYLSASDNPWPTSSRTLSQPVCHLYDVPK
jgi:p38 MAP kinase